MKILQLNELLIPLGFNKKGNNYTKKINDITYTINLQKSNYSDGYYINCRLDFEGGKKGWLSFRISNKNNLTNNPLFNLQNENDIDFIVEKLKEKFIAPLVNMGDNKSKIKEYVLSRPGVLLNIPAKEFLGIESDSLVF